MNPDFVAKLLESINCAILIVNHEGNIILSNTKAKKIFCTKVNTEKLTDHSDLHYSARLHNEVLEGLPIKSLFLPEDHEIFLPNILEITKNYGEFEGEALLRDLTGRRFFAFLSTSTCPIDGKQGLVFTIHDITNLKNVERILKKNERLIFWGRMLEDISHQIRNPILSIGGFARRISSLGEKKQKKYADIILHECSKLELLLSKLTEFIRLPRPKPRHVTVKEVVNRIKKPIEATVQKFSMEINWHISELDFDKKVLVDEELLPKAVVPVVENACESYNQSDKKNKIEVGISSTDTDGFSCSIIIKDNGMGICPKALPKVFDPFFTTKTGHIGMGLTISKRIIDELLGDIIVDSQYGTGTTVQVLLSEERRRAIRRTKIKVNLNG